MERMSREEEIAIILRAQNGDREAMGRLLEYHAGWIRRQAFKFRKHCQWIEVDDYVQMSAMGLMRAIEKFDPERGTRLLTMASDWMYASCQRERDSKRLIHVPVNNEQAGESYSTYGRAALKVKSLNAPVGTSGKEFAEVCGELIRHDASEDANSESEEYQRQRALLDKALSKISANERFVIQKLAEGLDCVEIGKLVGVTRARIQLVKAAAMEKIKAFVAAKTDRQEDWKERAQRIRRKLNEIGKSE